MNTKQQTTHTPTPWHISEYPNGYNLEILADDGIVATVRGTSGTVGETKANADFIVRACNAHEELVGALQKCKEAFETLQKWGKVPSHVVMLQYGINEINEKLAKTTGEGE